jgi:hypothetical protein
MIYAATRKPTKTFTIVGQGVDNGDDKIADAVAQSNENAINPNPVEPEKSQSHPHDANSFIHLSNLFALPNLLPNQNPHQTTLIQWVGRV